MFIWSIFKLCHGKTEPWWNWQSKSNIETCISLTGVNEGRENTFFENMINTWLFFKKNKIGRTEKIHCQWSLTRKQQLRVSFGLMAALWSSAAYVAQIQMLIHIFSSLEVVTACFHLPAPCSKQYITARKNLSISQGAGRPQDTDTICGKWSF